jgi:rubrerythrin
MLEFRTFEEILDFAILQEKAAQAFYTKMAAEVRRPEVRLLYLSLVDEESEHERRLAGLKQTSYQLTEPDIQALNDSGYLKALPVPPDITFRQAVKLAWDKERSARLLYLLLADTIDDRDFSDLFRQLADQEATHAEYFQREYADLSAGEPQQPQ